MKLLKDYLEELVYYGGEIKSRGYVIADLQRLGASDFVIGCYMRCAKYPGPPPLEGVSWSTPSPEYSMRGNKGEDD